MYICNSMKPKKNIRCRKDVKIASLLKTKNLFHLPWMLSADSGVCDAFCMASSLPGVLLERQQPAEVAVGQQGTDVQIISQQRS